MAPTALTIAFKAEDVDLLTVSKAVLSSKFKIAVLKDFCQRQQLTVHCTGKKGGSIKCDYVNAIVLYREKISDVPARPTEKRKRAYEDSAYESKKRPKIHPPAPNKVVRIRLYKNPKSFLHISEAVVECGTRGDIDLRHIELQLGFTGICRVIDPQNYQPFFRYNDNIIHADDLEDLMEDGFLRVVESF